MSRGDAFGDGLIAGIEGALHVPARLQGEGQPESELYRVLHRVGDRLQPRFRKAFQQAVEAHRSDLDLQALETALRRKDTDAAVRALGLDEMTTAMRLDLEESYRTTLQAAGQAVAEELASELDIAFSFNAVNPNAVLAARRDAGTLITRISRESRLAVRGIVGDMFTSGVPPDRAMRRIRDVVGMRRDYARAVVGFRDQLAEVQLLEGEEAISKANEAVARRLDAATKQRIRKLAREGGLTDALVEEFTDRYRKSLLNRRALDIGRTEAQRAAHAGQQESFRQAVQRGHLSRERTRRRPVVTPDDRLRPSHAAIPGMNPEGVGIEEPFQTPMGPMMYPPFDVNCRCSVALTFVGRQGVL